MGRMLWNFAEIYGALDKAHGAEQVTDVGKLAVRVGALALGTGAPIFAAKKVLDEAGVRADATEEADRGTSDARRRRRTRRAATAQEQGI